MRLKQKNYTLKLSESKSYDELVNYDFDKIKLQINDNLTSIGLLDLFLKISDQELDEEDNELTITGWSILQEIKDKQLIINNEPIKICFYSDELGTLQIIEIKNTLFQLNDKEIDEAEVKQFYDKIVELSKPVKTEEDNKSEAEEGTKPPLEASGTIIDDKGTIENDKYETTKLRYTSNGFKEYKFKDFRLLENSERGKLILVELLSPTELKQYSDYSETSKGSYKFASDDKDIIAKLTNNKLTIEVINK